MIVTGLFLSLALTPTSNTWGIFAQQGGDKKEFAAESEIMELQWSYPGNNSESLQNNNTSNSLEVN